MQQELSSSIPTGNAITVPANEVTNAPVVTHAPEQLDGNFDITVIARYPYQMDKCQAALIDWAKRKIESVKGECDDLQENVNIAKNNKWGSAALERARKRSLKTLDFYHKILAALEAGHCIVPNFPVDIIAVRTKRKNPVKDTNTDWQDTHTQSSESPPLGEGGFKSADTVIFKRPIEYTDSAGRVVKQTEYYAKEWAEFDFPFATAKPEILNAAARAMQDKFFDEIGVLPGKKKEDPIVVGRIYDPRSKEVTGWAAREQRHGRRRDARQRFVTFLIAWYVDTRTI